MQYASEAYKEEMLKPLRNQSYVWVYLGVIDQLAQKVATVEASQVYFSDDSQATNSPTFEGYYATMEQDHYRLDGGMYWLPESESYVAENSQVGIAKVDVGVVYDENSYILPITYYQGIVTELPYQSIVFSFGNYSVDLKGLTINFSDYYPTEFEISNGTTTRTYTKDLPGEFVMEDEFDDSYYISITPISMVGDCQRFRILSILFGVGLQFTNHEIKSTSMQASIDHISTSLPTKQFTFEVDNLLLKLNVDNPDSFADYLEEKQQCIYEYGRKLDDGTIERIGGGVTLLSKWSSNDYWAKFTTVGRLNYMNDEYIKGKYYEDGITAYDLAEDVFADAGITEYRLDAELQNVIIYNPLPKDTHKACLQLIANASRAIMYEDRDGYIVLKTSVLPAVDDIDQYYAEDYSQTDYLFTRTNVYDYATFEQDYFRLDGTVYWERESASGYLPGGFVSDYADSSGNFSSDPYIDITFDSACTINGMAMRFSGTFPTELVVYEYLEGTVQNSYTITDTDYVTTVSVTFENIDQLRIEFTAANAYQRVHLARILFEAASDYEITYTDMKETPTADKTEVVSNVYVHRYSYTIEDETEKLATVSVEVGSNIVTFDDDATDYSIAFEDEETEGNISITDYGAHYIDIYSDVEATVVITGTKFTIGDAAYTYTLNAAGTEKNLQNPLISTTSHARTVGAWLAEYFSEDVLYDITFRGNPVLDCDDVVYLENKYTDKNLVRISEQNFLTSGGVSNSCKVKARRIAYVNTQSVLGKAVVGLAIVGKTSIYEV